MSRSMLEPQLPRHHLHPFQACFLADALFIHDLTAVLTGGSVLLRRDHGARQGVVGIGST